MKNNYYSNRRGPTYYEEKNIIQKTSNKNLPAYVEDLEKRWHEAFKKTLPILDASTSRVQIAFKINDIDSKIRQIKEDPRNRQFFGLLSKGTPEQYALEREKWKLQKELEELKSNLIQEEFLVLTEKDLSAALNLATKRLDKIESDRKKTESLREKTSLIAEFQGKSRQVAKTVKPRLPINPVCPYCGKNIGEEPHADHIYPVSKGGRSTIANMVYICSTCNTRKRDLTLREFVTKHGLNREIIEKNLESLGKSF